MFRSEEDVAVLWSQWDNLPSNVRLELKSKEGKMIVFSE